MTLVKVNESLPTVSRWMDDFFNFDPFDFRGGNWPSRNTPAVNIKETDNNYLLEVAAPGLTKKDFNVSIDNGLLTISAEHEEKEEGYTRREFAYTSFNRTFTLPESVNADKVSAKYEDGILKVTVPKKEEAKTKPAKTIKIS